MGRRAVVLALCFAAAVAASVKGLQALGDEAEGGSPTPEAETSLSAAVGELPRPTRPAFRVGRPILLDRRRSLARFAPVAKPVEARALPRSDAAPVAFMTGETAEGTTNIVLVLGEVSRSGGTWVHVRLPVLPNERTGWVPRTALGGYQFVHTQLVVDRARFSATLVSHGRPVFRARVGVGRSAWPTPSGDFYIRDKVSGFDDPFYGPVAFGTSARSAVLTDWPGGGFVGIHGTNEPGLIPGRISHGCIRMRNEDILRLARLMPVGTPLTIK
jgi:lipoprotein-anchoring transpeptidase ErfK/SrfK